MLWLQRPPLVKWAVVASISTIAFWLEIRPEQVVDHPFAVVDIAPGEPIGSENTEMRAIPQGLLDPIPDRAHAIERISAGSPVLAADSGDRRAVLPENWWVVSVPLPAGAAVGDSVSLVLLDSGEAVDGIVSGLPGSGPFAAAEGGIAVDAATAPEVAMAAANGRVAVLLAAQ